MNVLSLFDGISCGMVALESAGIDVENYYSSEIDKYAIEISKYNYPLIDRLGDVRQSSKWELPKIDLLIGGSPCQSFSFAGKKNGMSTKCEIEITNHEHYLELKNENFDFDGQSYLFWEYVDLLKRLNPKYFLLENVRMNKKWKDIITQTLGVKPVLIDSSLVSAQERKRLYWTNINFDKNIQDKNIFIGDIWAGGIDITDRFYKKEVGTLAYEKANSSVRTLEQKSKCLTTGGQNISNSGATNIKIGDRYFKIDLLTSERLQTLPDNYTKVDGISDTQRYKSIGNGWTKEVIVHIFKGLSNEPIEQKTEVKMTGGFNTYDQQKTDETKLVDEITPEETKSNGCDFCKNNEICKYYESFKDVKWTEKICKYYILEEP